jgi:predicted transglutaminase-like cysteine proteinase
VLRVLLAGLLALHALASPAWDADRMQQAAARIGPRAQASLRALLPLLQQGRGQDDETRLQAVNQFFNRHVLFRTDVEIYGVADHWASPLETLGLGQGDCEDYAIAKYFSLVAMGIPVAKLRLVYVRAQIGSSTQAHMVLAYYAEPLAEPLILDNLIGELRPASRRPDLQPVFSFNSEGLWQGTGDAPAGDPVQRLSRWREVLAKVRGEGFL